MATILSRSSTTGFYNAPVTKGLMGCLFLTCTSLNVPLFAHLRRYLICNLPEVISKGEIWRILLAKLSFVDMKDLVVGFLLMYYFRIFERRYGSHKFASYLIANQCVTTLLETVTVLSLHYAGFDLHNGGHLPPGPYGLIFPLFVSYYCDIPHVAQTRVLGVPITGKTLTYLLGLQLAYTSPATAISALCGVVSGLIYRHNVLYIQRLTFIPAVVGRFAAATLGPLLASAPPQETLTGATLELQRQEEMELWDQQMLMRQRGRHMQMEGDEGRRAGAELNGFLNPQPPPPPSEDQIQTLVAMGFDRQRVLSALRDSHNDVNTASHILLQQAS
ncbi:ubiquitin-associated domain-containing protein 2 [Hyalella azteca]|uniref:Ubiquitin-associated domain-containing protein 2 n=1 Tax=Hyalella azteca TaxID=294128 RepID=A0A8B7NNV3_HYAAZ|nr:ubiquitin-associated domain-containing protein 2 [Hyalella azteca]